jgi:hypothetical protein
MSLVSQGILARCDRTFFGAREIERRAVTPDPISAEELASLAAVRAPENAERSSL